MNIRIAPLSIGVWAALLAVTLSLLCGCTVVKINHDSTNSIEHKGGEEAGKELASRACHKARAVRAEVLSTVKKDPTASEERALYVTTFRCIY